MLLVFDVSSVFPFITLPSKSASTLFPYPQKIQKLECCPKFLPLSDLLNPVTVVPSFSAGDTFQDPQWMPEIRIVRNLCMIRCFFQHHYFCTLELLLSKTWVI